MVEEAAVNSKYSFLDKHDPHLGIAITEAEDAFGRGWPNGCARAARLAAELMCDHVAIRNNLPACGIKLPYGSTEKRPGFVRRLVASGAIPSELKEGVLKIVWRGNDASHWKVILSDRRLVSMTEAADILSTLQAFAMWFGKQDGPHTGDSRQPQPDFAYRPDESRKPSPFANDNTRRPFADSHWPSLIRSVALIILIVGVGWFGWQLFGPSSFSNTTVSWPRQFVVTPAGTLVHGHVRSLPDTASSIVAEPVRGTVITGAAEVKDANGDPWIKLSDGSGYIKESILRPTTTNAPTPPSSNQPGTSNAPSTNDAPLSTTATPNPSGLQCSPYCYVASDGQIMNYMPSYPYPVSFSCKADWRVGDQQLCTAQPTAPASAAPPPSPAPAPPADTSQTTPGAENPPTPPPQSLAQQPQPGVPVFSFAFHLGGRPNGHHR